MKALKEKCNFPKGEATLLFFVNRIIFKNKES